MKVLAVTPTENESPDQFAARAATQVQQFFGEQEPTDVSAEEAAPATEAPAEG